MKELVSNNEVDKDRQQLSTPLSFKTEGSALNTLSATSQRELICSASRKNLGSSEGFQCLGLRNSRSTSCMPCKDIDKMASLSVQNSPSMPVLGNMR